MFCRKGIVVKRGHLHGMIPLETLDKLEEIYPRQQLGFAGHYRQVRGGKGKHPQIKG